MHQSLSAPEPQAVELFLRRVRFATRHAATTLVLLAGLVSASPEQASASGKISGTVLYCEDNAGANTARVRIKYPDGTFHSYYANSSGQYTTGTLNNGSYEVVCIHVGYQIDVGYPSVVINNNNPVANFKVQSCTISGSVRDGCNDVPATGVSVHLTGQKDTTVVTAYPSGIYEVKHVPKGHFYLNIIPPPGYSLWPGEEGSNYTDLGPIGACEVSAPHNRRLAAYHTISGGVRTSNDASPVAGVTVTFSGPTPVAVITDASGVYTSPPLVQGAYTITPTKAGRTFTGGKSLTLGCDDLTGQNMIMYNAHVSGGIRDGCQTGSVPVGGVPVTLSGPANATMMTNPISGVYEFDNLANGTYHIHIDGIAGMYSVQAGDADRDVTVGGTDSDGHNARMLAYHRITGRSVSYDDANLGIPNDNIQYGNECGSVQGQVWTDASGYYQTPLLPQDAYSVWAGNCTDKTYACRFGNPITLDCSGDQTANFRQKGLPSLTITSAAPQPDGHSIGLAWTAGNGLTAGYRLLRSSNATGPFSTLTDVSTTSFVDAGLPCGATYYYEVCPLNECSRQGAPSPAVGCTNSLCVSPVALVAPASGSTIRPPETFSWTAVSAATSYEIQLSQDAGFGTFNWSTTSALTNVVVPTAATPVVGVNYFWRVRARNAQYSSDWASGVFQTSQTISTPQKVVLSSPADGTVIPGHICVLQWQQAEWATSYRVEVSTTGDFNSGAGSTIVLSGVTALFTQVSLGPDAQDVFWRATGQNALGVGVPSDINHLVLSSSAEGVAGVTITEPATDVTVAVGAELDLHGLVVGQASGPVSLQWLLDENPIGAQLVTLDGSGVDAPPFAYTPTVLGTHDLSLSVSGSGNLISTRHIAVVQADFGPATQLVVYADSPLLTAGDSTIVYCTVRDAAGRIVLSDNGRMINFAVTHGIGALDGASQPTLNGTAFALYRSSIGDSAVTIMASEAASEPSGTDQVLRVLSLPNASSNILCTSELAKERTLAIGYLARLHDANALQLDRNIMPPIVGFDYLVSRLKSINVGSAETFVNGATDPRRLRRLNMLLKMMHRAMYSGTATTLYPNNIPQPSSVAGLATVIEEQALLLGEEWNVGVEAALAPFKPFQYLKCIAGLPTFQKRAHTYTQDMTRVKNEMLYNARRTIPISKQDGFAKRLGKNVLEFGNALYNAGLLTVGNAGLEVFQPGWEVRVTGEVIVASNLGNEHYVKLVQGELDAMVTFLSSPTANLGSDDVAASTVDRALAAVQRKAGIADAQYRAADAAFNSWQLNVTDCFGIAKKYKYSSKVVDVLKQLGIFNAAGATLSAISDCEDELTTASVALRNQALYAPNSAHARTRALRPAVPTRMGRMSATRVAGIVEDELGSQVVSYETLARDLEVCVEASDSTCSLQALSGLEDSNEGLTDAEGAFIGPFFAVSPSARYDVPQFSDLLDSLSAGCSSASGARGNALMALRAWLAAPSTDSLRLAALEKLRLSIDSTGVTFGVMRDRLPTVLGELGMPLLVLSSPRACRVADYGDTVTVSLVARNLGGVTATASSITLRSAGNALAFLGDSTKSVAPLDPGQGITLTWTVRDVGAVPDSDSVAVVSIVASPDSGSAPGTSSGAALGFRFNRSALGVGTEIPNVYRLYAPVPNPSHSAVSIVFSVPQRERVSLRVFDVAGRVVQIVQEGELDAGRHELRWDGRDAEGHATHAGVYFVRLSARNVSLTRMLVRLK